MSLKQSRLLKDFVTVSKTSLFKAFHTSFKQATLQWSKPDLIKAELIQSYMWLQRSERSVSRSVNQSVNSPLFSAQLWQRCLRPFPLWGPTGRPSLAWSTSGWFKVKVWPPSASSWRTCCHPTSWTLPSTVRSRSECCSFLLPFPATELEQGPWESLKVHEIWKPPNFQGL